MTTIGTIEARKAALFARTSTASLIQSALLLDAKEMLTAEERLTRSWIWDEIERRHPEVRPATEAWLKGEVEDLSYTEVLIAALPVSVVAR